MALKLAQRLAPISLPDADGARSASAPSGRNRPAVVVFLRHYG